MFILPIRFTRYQKILTVLLTTVVFLQFANSNALATTSSVIVGIIGDQTGTMDLNNAYSILEEGVSILSKKGVRIVLHVGDIVESKKSEGDYRKDFARAASIMDHLNKPWFMTPGDHDVNPPDFYPGSNDRSREELFVELYGSRVPQVKKHIYYSFNFEGYHFIALNSQETLHVDPRWGDIFLAHISDEQLQWLATDLEQNKGAKAIVVFLHQPLWYNWSAWMKVHQLLRQYPVATVIAGHFHYDQDDGVIDGIRYVIVGATGGSVKNASCDAGNVHHVTIMTLEEGHVDFQLLPVGSSQPMSITPRIDMDRVQALDQLLDKLWDFSERNPVYFKDGKLVSSCEANDPAKIKLTSVGNPLDVPLTIKIGFTSEMIGITSAKFQQCACQSVISDTQCVLYPGARIAIANLSSVDIKEGIEPLWDALLILTGSGVPQYGTPLDIDVRLSFEGEQGELSIERHAKTWLCTCPR